MSIKTQIAAFVRINDQHRAELKKLMKQPEMFDVAQALTDAMIKQLNYLCNFRSIIDGNGKTYKIPPVMKKLENNIRKEFKSLTGKEYKPPICRRFKL